MSRYIKGGVGEKVDVGISRGVGRGIGDRVGRGVYGGVYSGAIVQVGSGDNGSDRLGVLD